MWKVEHPAFQNVIRVTAAGAISVNDLEDQLNASMTLIRRYKCELGLVDYSLADIKVSIADLYILPDKLIAAGMPKTVKIAVVFPETGYQIEKYEFVENVMTHRGFDLRLFTNAESAMRWLAVGIELHRYNGTERRMLRRRQSDR
jgi:hypothetical protein